MFKQIKVTQAAAWFLQQAAGSMTILKLMKLLYLADRHALAELGFSISGDRMVSMPHGPVLSETLELANGQSDSLEGGWDSWILDRAGREIALRPDRAVTREALDQLSDAEIAVLRKVQDEFGQRSAIALRDYTHRQCAEWQDPKGSSQPIAYETVLKAVGKSPAEAAAIAARLEEDRALDAVFASL